MESQTRTTTFRFSLDYLKSINGILKIIQLVFSIITFGTATHVSDFYRVHGGGLGFVSFVAISGFIMALIYLVFHLFIHSSWQPALLIELISYAVWTVLFLISGIVAAAFAAKYKSYGWWQVDDTCGAAAAFAFFSMVVWAIDTAFQAKNIRVEFTSSSHAATTTTTTTTSTSTAKRFEENPQY